MEGTEVDVQPVVQPQALPLISLPHRRGWRFISGPNQNLLLSTLDRIENRLHYDLEATVPTLTALLGWCLIKHHVSLDGNKRIGLATFLALNAHEFLVREDEVKVVVLRVAANEVDGIAWAAWLISVTAAQSLSSASI